MLIRTQICKLNVYRCETCCYGLFASVARHKSRQLFQMFQCGIEIIPVNGDFCCWSDIITHWNWHL